MTNNGKPYILFVDDDPKLRKAMKKILEQFGFNANCFSCAADCLQHLSSQLCDLPSSGVKTHSTGDREPTNGANDLRTPLLILVVSDHEHIAMALQALGSLGTTKKPVDRPILWSAVEHASTGVALSGPFLKEGITKTEVSILRLVLDGKSNTEIAHFLHRSVRTVEAHRRHIRQKLGVHNLIELVKKSALIGLIELPRED